MPAPPIEFGAKTKAAPALVAPIAVPNAPPVFSASQAVAPLRTAFNATPNPARPAIAPPVAPAIATPPSAAGSKSPLMAETASAPPTVEVAPTIAPVSTEPYGKAPAMAPLPIPAMVDSMLSSIERQGSALAITADANPPITPPIMAPGTKNSPVGSVRINGLPPT